MKFLLVPRSPAQPPLGAALLAGMFLLPMGAWAVTHGHIAFGTCGMKQALDLPCLTCGATRATIHLLHGDLGQALALNPLVIATYALLALWGLASLASLAAGQRVVAYLGPVERWAVRLAFLGLPLVNWAYLIAAGV